MAPQYKITYFNVRGVAEPSRYILSYAGIDFEDVRITGDKWSELKESIGKFSLYVNHVYLFIFVFFYFVIFYWFVTKNLLAKMEGVIFPVNYLLLLLFQVHCLT